jgi:hypothetical protein
VTVGAVRRCSGLRIGEGRSARGACTGCLGEKDAEEGILDREWGVNPCPGVSALRGAYMALSAS